MRPQGYGLSQTILHQDDKSAILLENNVRMCSGECTKHVSIRCCFIKDRITKRELLVEHCPTGEMTADFFTKPLQGKLFSSSEKQS
jgi:hypothetical protein